MRTAGIFYRPICRYPQANPCGIASVLHVVCMIRGTLTPITCPPRRPGRISACQAALISRNLVKTMATYKPVSLRNLIKKVGGSSVVRLLDA